MFPRSFLEWVIDGSPIPPHQTQTHTHTSYVYIEKNVMQLKRAYFSYTHISNERTTRRLDVRPLYMRSAHYSKTVHIKFHPRVNSQRRHTAQSVSQSHTTIVSVAQYLLVVYHTADSSQSECLCAYTNLDTSPSVGRRARALNLQHNEFQTRERIFVYI